jgi:sugar phosphate isomerase/epimerase
MKISLSLEYAESGTLAERLHAVAEAGIPAVNLGTSQIRHLLATAPSETELLNEQITVHGLAVDWVHTPFRLAVLYDASTELYHISMGLMKSVITSGAALKAATVIVHAMNKDFPADIATPKYLDQLITSYRVLVAFGNTYGVKIAVENIDEPYSLPIIETLLAEVDGLTLCFDTGHAEKYGVWDDYLPAYLNKISSLHIHDNHGEVDAHLIPGDGTIDFSALLSGLHSTGYNGYLGVECVQRVSDYPGDFLSLASLIKTRMSRLEN